MVPVPVAGPYVAVVRNPRFAPAPESWNDCPAATTLSDWPAGTFGHPNCMPLCVIAEPGVTPTEASACADRLEPAPSMLPTLVLVSSVMPTLLNAELRSVDGTTAVIVAWLCTACPPSV